MKKLLIVMVAILLLFSCVSKNNDSNQGLSGTTALNENNTSAKGVDDELSYAFGVSIGSSLKSFGVTVEYNSFVTGMKDVLEKNAPQFTADEANRKINTALQELESKKGEASLKEGTEFLEKNKKKSGVIETASGLQYEVITKGSGPKPSLEDTVEVHYKGTLLDGTEFDSSYNRGQPAVFPLDGVIAGWTEGLQLMPVGSKYKLYIPSSLGYGPSGAGGMIGPNATLIFEVELLSIKESSEGNF